MGHSGKQDNGQRPKVNILVSAQRKGKRPPSPKVLTPEPAPELGQWEDSDKLDELDDRPRISVWVADRSQRSQSLKANLLFWSFWLTAAGLVLGGGWIGLQLIVNPGSVGWLRWALPEWSRSPFVRSDHPRTWVEIQAELQPSKQILGAPLPLDDSGDVLMPVIAQCEADSPTCGHFVELRVYRIEATYPERTYRLIEQFTVPGLEEFFVTAPLADVTPLAGSTRTLPFDAVTPIEGKAPTPGIWLNVSGTWTRGNDRIVYGQVLRYDADRSRLESLLDWTSPVAQQPAWKNITGSNAAELVVNQTVGLEPHFQVYQVRSIANSPNPIQLEPIALSNSAFRSPTYDKALLLARNGLWSPARQLLEGIKRQTQNAQWTTAAQAQLDLVSLHAQQTQQQADRDWASPGQQITALLIDGRWGTALGKLQAAIGDGHDLTPLLKDESGRLWNRVTAALRVNSRQADARIWGALMLTTQQGRGAAIAWIRQQQRPTPVRSGRQAAQTPAFVLDARTRQFIELIDRPLNASRNEGNTTSPTANQPAANHFSRLVGTATPIPAPNPAQWLRPNPREPLSLDGQQTWYEIPLLRFYDGQRWQRSPFSFNFPPQQAASRLWNLLGLSNDRQLQLIVATTPGEFVSLQATVKAVRFQNGVVSLLAAGDMTPEPRLPFAITANTLSWLEPPSLTLADLTQTQPDQANVLLVNLWQELQQAGFVVSTPVTLPDILQETGSWTIKSLDLTGDNQPEAIVHLYPSLLAQSRFNALNLAQGSPPTRTLIFSSQGQLLYSDLQQMDRSMVAIADLQEGGLPTLIVQTGQAYSLERWSSQAQQFQPD